MKRAIAIACLVVFALGIGTLVYADIQKVKCTHCGSGAYTTAHYYCTTCEAWYAYDAWSEDGNPPPYNMECPYCHLTTNPASYCTCANPTCVGGVFWRAE